MQKMRNPVQGGGGRLAAMAPYTKAPRDGTMLGVIVQSIAPDSVTGQMPQEVDPQEFNFDDIGLASG